MFQPKGVYYLYLHPWASLNPKYPTFKTIHAFLCGGFLIGAMVASAYYLNSSAVSAFIISLGVITAFMGLLFSFLKFGSKFSCCYQKSNLCCQKKSDEEDQDASEENIALYDENTSANRALLEETAL